MTDVILVDTETVRQDGIEKRIKDPEKIIVVNMGVDLQRFSPDRIPQKGRVRESPWESRIIILW